MANYSIEIQRNNVTLPSWCRILPLNLGVGKRKKKKAGKPLIASDIF